MYEDPQDMFREMDEMFARMFTRMSRGMGGGEPQVFGYHIVLGGGDESGSAMEEPAAPPRGDSAPVAEVHRIGDEVKVIVELPGASAESVALDVRDNKLLIDADGCMNQYHTVADLPPVNAASMQFTFRNGVLEVTFGTLPGSADSPADGKA